MKLYVRGRYVQRRWERKEGKVAYKLHTLWKKNAKREGTGFPIPSQKVLKLGLCAEKQRFSRPSKALPWRSIHTGQVLWGPHWSKCSAEVNSACAKIFAGAKMLVDEARHGRKNPPGGPGGSEFKLIRRSSASAGPRKPCRDGLRRGPSHGRCRGWRPGSAPWPSWPARTYPG